MASPLRKRLPRELNNNIGKYLGMFLLLTIAICHHQAHTVDTLLDIRHILHLIALTKKILLIFLSHHILLLCHILINL